MDLIGRATRNPDLGGRCFLLWGSGRGRGVGHSGDWIGQDGRGNSRHADFLLRGGRSGRSHLGNMGRITFNDGDGSDLCVCRQTLVLAWIRLGQKLQDSRCLTYHKWSPARGGQQEHRDEAHKLCESQQSARGRSGFVFIFVQGGFEARWLKDKDMGQQHGTEELLSLKGGSGLRGEMLTVGDVAKHGGDCKEHGNANEHCD